MPFLTLNNNASSLAEYYNNITPNGVFTGTSKNPNVTGTQKPDIPNIQFVDFDEGSIRGGLVNAGIATAKDLIRIGKFLTGIDVNTNVSLSKAGQGINATQGFLFLAKQVGLQLSNPRLEWDRSNLLPPLFGGPTRQFTGVGTLLSVGGNAFGLHFDRAGLLGDIREDQKYESVTIKNNFSDEGNNITPSDDSRNRLVRYLSRISGKKEVTEPINLDSDSQIRRLLNNYNSNTTVLDTYMGGPGSVYGIGRTTIRTSSDINARTIIRSNDLGSQTFDAYKKGSVTQLEILTEAEDRNSFIPLSSFGGNNLGNSFVKSVSTFNTSEQASFTIGSTNPNLVKKLNSFVPTTNEELTSIEDNIDRTENSIPIPTTPAVTNITVPGYNIENRFGVSTNNNLDAINTINIVGSEFFYGNEGKNIAEVEKTDKDNPYNTKNTQGNFGDDLVKFRIEFLNNEKLLTSVNTVNTDVLAFRAYIDDFSDGMAAKWDSYRYMGRGEEFYIYNGFTRDIAVSFTIHAHSEEEMAPLYNKLNYLMSAFTPDYSAAFKMRGNIGYLTVGDYLYRQPGIFTDIKIGGFMDSSWDTGLNDTGEPNGQFQVPRMLKIGLSFKPIHTFLPRRNYRSTDASGKVGQVFQAPFITPDRNAYPVKDADGNKIANQYLIMDTKISTTTANNDNSTYKAKRPKDIKAFQNWLDKNHPGWFPKGKGGKLNKKKGYGVFGANTESAWNQYQNEYNASSPK